MNPDWVLTITIEGHNFAALQEGIKRYSDEAKKATTVSGLSGLNCGSSFGFRYQSKIKMPDLVQAKIKALRDEADALEAEQFNL